MLTGLFAACAHNVAEAYQGSGDDQLASIHVHVCSLHRLAAEFSKSLHFLTVIASGNTKSIGSLRRNGSTGQPAGSSRHSLDLLANATSNKPTS